MNNATSLSIVIPTLNRAPLLEVTLRLAAESIQRSDSSVELLICDNASEDNTKEVVDALREEFPFIGYHYFSERVSIDHSFKRSVAKSSGDYVWILGDDDFPLFGSLARLLEALESYPECRFIHFDRLVADPKMRSGSFGFHVPDFGDEVLTGCQLIERVLFRPGFVSSFISHRDLWTADFDFEPYAGYGFLTMIYQQVFDEPCLLIGEPLVVQRSSLTAWKSEWPRYLLLSMPRIIKLLPFTEEKQLQILGRWRHGYSRPKQFTYNALLALSSGFITEDAWKEVLNYQGRLNRNISKLVKLLPRAFCGWALSAYLDQKHN